MISSIWCYHSRGLEYCSSWAIDARQPSVYMTVGHRPILLLLAGSLPADVYAAAVLYTVNDTIFAYNCCNRHRILIIFMLVTYRVHM